MNFKTLPSLFISCAIIIVGIILVTGCAQMVAPLGGPRDSLPAIMIAAKPQDSSIHFTGNKITINFSEYIQLDNVHDNLIVSPVPKLEPLVEAKLRTLNIKLKDTLEENTTYTLEFGKAIKDVNEGNITRNFSYVFSTGAFLDSFELRGKVILAQTGKTDSTLIVMLHRNGDDSAVIKERPRYIAKLDSGGHFRFQHLPSGKFYVYTIKDEGGQKKFLSKTQIFGFADKPVSIGAANEPVLIYAYLERDTAGYKPAAKTVKPPVTAKTDKTKEQDKRLKFSNNLSSGFQDLLGDLEFLFFDPLKSFDSSKVRFTDETFKPISNYTIARDSTNKKLILHYKWTEHTGYNLIVDKDFAEDSTGRKIPRTDTLSFKTLKESDYGKLVFRFVNLDLKKRPVLQIFQGEDIRLAQKITGKDFSVKLFKPGEYQIRILFDDNNNGIWDPGEFFGKHLQPEKVLDIPRKLNVKANWDNEVTIQL